MEIWLSISHFPNYEVSSYGRIRNKKTRRILQLFDRGHGYVGVNLGNGNLRSVHRIVESTFFDVNPEDWIVNDKDGDKTNNHISNLEWVTYLENNNHAIQLGLRPPGSRYGIKTVQIIETGECFKTLHSCARFINGDARHISDCLKNRRKSHRGFSFRYVED